MPPRYDVTTNRSAALPTLMFGILERESRIFNADRVSLRYKLSSLVPHLQLYTVSPAVRYYSYKVYCRITTAQLYANSAAIEIKPNCGLLAAS